MDQLHNPDDALEYFGGDIGEVDLRDMSFDQAFDHVFQPEDHPEGFQFRLPVLPIHRWDACRDMPLVIYVFPTLAGFGIQDDPIEDADILQHLADGALVIGAAQGLLQLVFGFLVKERITLEELYNVVRVEVILVQQQIIYVAEVDQPLLLVSGVFAKFPEQPGYPLPGQVQQLVRIQAFFIQKAPQEPVLRLGLPVGLRDIEGHVCGNDAIQMAGIQVMPKPHDLAHQVDMGIVAFRVHLLAQKVDQAVASAAHLVDGGRVIPYFPFRANLVEKDREQPQQVFHLHEIGFDIGVQELADVFLEEVGIGNEHPFDRQVDDQGGEQFLGAGHIHAD